MLIISNPVTNASVTPPPGLGHFYRSIILTDRYDIFVDWSSDAQCTIMSFSPTLRKKITLLKTVRCFFIGHFSKCEAQFEGMCLSISGTRHSYWLLKLSCWHYVSFQRPATWAGFTAKPAGKSNPLWRIAAID